MQDARRSRRQRRSGRLQKRQFSARALHCGSRGRAPVASRVHEIASEDEMLRPTPAWMLGPFKAARSEKSTTGPDEGGRSVMGQGYQTSNFNEEVWRSSLIEHLKDMRHSRRRQGQYRH
jgi:hypothetical protein